LGSGAAFITSPTAKTGEASMSSASIIEVIRWSVESI
jgi:hypothetical protein